MYYIKKIPSIIMSIRQSIANLFIHPVETYQHIKKTNNLHSIISNIFHHTIPLAAGCLVHNFLPIIPLPGLSYIASIAPWIGLGVNMHSYLYRDESKTIDTFIHYFDQLTTLNEVLPEGNPDPTTFNPKDPISFQGCLHAIDAIVNNASRDLFNWQSVTGENRKPFEKLREVLKESQNCFNPKNVIEATQEVIAKLIEFKATRAGILTTSYQKPDIHPRYQQLLTSLNTLQQTLALDNSPERSSLKELQKLIDLTLQVKSVFTQTIPHQDSRPASEKFLQNLTELKTLLKDFEKIPNTLKDCAHLHPNKEDLKNKLQLLLAPPQPPFYHGPLNILPFANHPLSQPCSLALDQLHQALQFYPSFKTSDNEKDLENHLYQLLNIIDELYYPNFKNDFLLEVGKQFHPKSHVAKNKQPKEAQYRKWAADHLVLYNLLPCLQPTLEKACIHLGLDPKNKNVKDLINLLSEHKKNK